MADSGEMPRMKTWWEGEPATLGMVAGSPPVDRASSYPIQIEDVRRLDVRPGDRLLLTLSGRWTAKDLERLEDAVRTTFGDDVKCLAVPAGEVDVSVVRLVD